MSEQICLKWNSFLNNIATSFESLWEDEGLVDVTLTSDGQCLTAHKLILSSSSPFFKKVFQTNRSQHPVIVFQDIHFSELQALLIFIYKGEVNIDQKKLPALLKAAETLQIRGLSGGDILNRDCYTRLDELEQSASEGTGQSQFAAEPRRKKKQKVSDFQGHGNQMLDKILIPRITRSLSRASESSSSDKGVKDGDGSNDAANSGYRRLEMKLEPVEVMAEDLQKFPHANNEKDKLETGHSDGDQGETRDNSTEDISGLSGLTGLGDDKPILYAYQQLPHAELLPNPDVITSWASSRPIDHLACDLMKILFTTEERILCNVNGKMGKQQFDSSKIHLIREVLLHYSTITPNSVEWEEAWKNCVTKIDTSNRGLKRYLFQRRSVYSQ